MGDLKTKATELSVEDYLASIDALARQAEAREVAAIMQRLSGEPPKMWGASMVGFGRYHYRYDSGREGEMFRLGFAARKNALVLYVMDGFPRHAELLSRLGRHTTGKSCLYLKKLSDVDASVLDELLAASLAHMREKHPV